MRASAIRFLAAAFASVCVGLRTPSRVEWLGPPAGHHGQSPPDPNPADPKPNPIPSPSDRPVAKVGDEIVTLADLTVAVQRRIAEFPPGVSPSKRQLIGLTRSVLKALVVRSLVLQEARAVLGGADGLASATRRIDQLWLSDEQPALLGREGVASVDQLRALLADRLTTLEALRDEFVVRSLALEMMAREPSPIHLDAYLDDLRRRRPITSMISPIELAQEGRRVATEAAVVR